MVVQSHVDHNVLGEVHEAQYLFQDYGPTFQTSPLASSKINPRRASAFESLLNVVVLPVRQM